MSRKEEIQKLIDEETGIYNYGSSDYQVGVCDGVRLADKTMIERVLNFIFNHFYDHPHTNGHICTDSFSSLENLEEELIKAMKE
jgi:hypothetical protein